MKRECRVTRQLPRNCKQNPIARNPLVLAGKGRTNRELAASQETCHNAEHWSFAGEVGVRSLAEHIPHPVAVIRHRVFQFPPCESSALSHMKSLLSSILSVLLSFTAVAQQVDTMFYSLKNEVVVTATRIPIVLARAPSPVQVFQQKEIRALSGSNLSDVMNVAGGSMMRSYGGDGSLSLPSIRGLGAEYSIVFLDGVRLNDAQNGLVDLSRFPLMTVEQIEVARGGFATLYGTDALGGVVNVRSGAPDSPLTLAGGAGSFGFRSFDLSARYTDGSSFLNAGSRYEEARNDYPFLTQQGEVTRRDNARYVQRFISALGRTTMGSSVLSFMGQYMHRDAGVPGAYRSVSQGRAHQSDRTVFLSTTLLAPLAKGIELSIVPSLSWTHQRYRDPAIVTAGVPLESTFENLGLGLESSALMKLSSQVNLSVLFDLRYATLATAQTSGKPERITGAVSLAGEWRTTILHRAMSLYPSLRIDRIEGKPSERGATFFSPGVGIFYQAIEAIAIRAHIARGFRVPTFNQLYWNPGGNPELQPEYSTAMDAGVVIAPQSLPLRMEATWFRHDVRDRIVWMPASASYWSPRNIQHVIADGIEASVELQPFGDALALRLNGQWTDARKMNASFPGDATQGKRLVYVPDFSSSFMLLYRTDDRMTFALTGHHIGERFGQEDNHPSSALPPHILFDFAVTFAIQSSLMDIGIKGEVRNMFDESYEVIAFYPMPPRSFRLTLTTQLH